MDSDKILEFHTANCLEKVKYFTWMAVGLPWIPRRALYLGMKKWQSNCYFEGSI